VGSFSIDKNSKNRGKQRSEGQSDEPEAVRDYDKNAPLETDATVLEQHPRQSENDPSLAQEEQDAEKKQNELHQSLVTQPAREFKLDVKTRLLEKARGLSKMDWVILGAIVALWFAIAVAVIWLIHIAKTVFG
jgi:hypothetical protein